MYNANDILMRVFKQTCGGVEWRHMSVLYGALCHRRRSNVSFIWPLTKPKVSRDPFKLRYDITFMKQFSVICFLLFTSYFIKSWYHNRIFRIYFLFGKVEIKKFMRYNVTKYPKILLKITGCYSVENYSIKPAIF